MRRRGGGGITNAIWFVIALCILIAIWNGLGRTPSNIYHNLAKESVKFEHWLGGLVHGAESKLPATSDSPTSTPASSPTSTPSH